MTALGFALMWFGIIIVLLGEIRFMVLTYRRGLGWFLACLLLPFVCWVFFLINFKNAWRPVALRVVGIVLASIGWSMGGADF